MLALALEEELLIEWDDPVRLSLPKNLLIFLQKNQQMTKLMERVRNKNVSG
jgi:hypothetical protein